MSIAGDYEFFSRPEWAGLRGAYGLSFRNHARCRGFMYAACVRRVDVRSYTSDGLIANTTAVWKIQTAIPPYDASCCGPERSGDTAWLQR